MKHTPGSWKVEMPPHSEGLSSSLLKKNPDAIHIVSHGTIWGFGVSIAALGEGEDAEANARLIAAAPEMLEALKIALDALGCDRLRQDRLVAQKIINTAIKKAKGERK